MRLRLSGSTRSQNISRVLWATGVVGIFTSPLLAAQLNLNGVNVTLPDAAFFAGKAFINGTDTATNNGAAAATLIEGGGPSGTTYSGVISNGTSSTALEHTGGLVTILSAQTYTGPTTIDAGTFALSGVGSVAASSGIADNGTFDISATTAGTSIKTLSGAGAVTLGARSLTLTAGSTTFSGVIGGTGGLTLSGGTETLSGINSFSGATTISSGATLALSGAGSLAASSGITDNGTFDISATTSGTSIKTLSGAGAVTLGAQPLMLTAGSTTFSGVFGGTGGLTLSGGTETLSGVNTYSGATTINSGATLALSGAGSVAASSGITDNGTFNISATAAGTSIKTLSGAGAVTLGARPLTLTA